MIQHSITAAHINQTLNKNVLFSSNLVLQLLFSSMSRKFVDELRRSQESVWEGAMLTVNRCLVCKVRKCGGGGWLA